MVRVFHTLRYRRKPFDVSRSFVIKRYPWKLNESFYTLNTLVRLDLSLSHTIDISVGYVPSIDPFVYVQIYSLTI